MFHRQSSNSIKQLKCGYKINCKSQQDRSRRLPPFSWRIAKLKSIRKANHGRSIHESYSIRSLKFPSNKRFKKPNFFRGSLLRFTTTILKWLQVTWSLAWYFTQSQLTEMLAYEHCRTGGSAENRFFPSNRQPKFRPGGRGQHVRFGWPDDNCHYEVTTKEARKCTNFSKMAPSPLAETTFWGGFLQPFQL